MLEKLRPSGDEIGRFEMNLILEIQKFACA